MRIKIETLCAALEAWSAGAEYELNTFEPVVEDLGAEIERTVKAWRRRALEAEEALSTLGDRVEELEAELEGHLSKTVLFVLENDFHNTTTSVRVMRADVEDGSFALSGSQCKRAYRTLCGINECSCSSKEALGVRGTIEDPLERKGDDGSLCHWEIEEKYSRSGEVSHVRLELY